MVIFRLEFFNQNVQTLRLIERFATENGYAVVRFAPRVNFADDFVNGNEPSIRTFVRFGNVTGSYLQCGMKEGF